MRLLVSEQISSNRKFRETYQKQNKKKKEVKDDFHKMLIDEQEQLDQLKY
jgi:hypothetical protein